MRATNSEAAFVERRKADRDRREGRGGGRRRTDISEARYAELLAMFGGLQGRERPETEQRPQVAA